MRNGLILCILFIHVKNVLFCDTQARRLPPWLKPFPDLSDYMGVTENNPQIRAD